MPRVCRRVGSLDEGKTHTRLHPLTTPLRTPQTWKVTSARAAGEEKLQGQRIARPQADSLVLLVPLGDALLLLDKDRFCVCYLDLPAEVRK